MSDVVIVDSGVANFASVQAAFARLGAGSIVSSDPDVLRKAERLVVPGVGAFGAGVASLRSSGLDVPLRDACLSGKPVLAICLGLQMLAEASDESPGIPGLGVLKGKCRRLPNDVRVPQLGWNSVMPDESCRMVAPMEAAFANSYAMGSAPAGWSAAWSTHGAPFVAAVERGSVLGCQFHPELSGREGEELIERWLLGSANAQKRKSPGAHEPRGAAAQGRGSPGAQRRNGGGALAVRIVPCLDVREGRVVKGIRFTGLRDAGDPVELAARYEGQGADEVVLLDIAASPANRATQVSVVRGVRAVLSIPLTAGGGVRTVEDARALLAAGADKVSVNSAAVARPKLIAELAREFGRQCVVLAIDAKRSASGWDVLVMGGRQRATGLDAVDWAETGAASGAGEILLTSWDSDGTRGGCDLPLLRAVSAAVNVPIVASGGIGSRHHVAEAIEAGAGAVLAASVFHDGEDTVPGIKDELARRGMRVRL